MKVGGILKLLFGFRLEIFATSGSSIHTQLQTVLLHKTQYLPTQPNGLQNGKIHIPSPLPPYLLTIPLIQTTLKSTLLLPYYSTNKLTTYELHKYKQSQIYFSTL